MKKTITWSPKDIKAKALFISAQYRALIFGGKKLVNVLAEYRQTMNTKENNVISVKLFQEMRNDLLEDEQVDNKTVEEVLFLGISK